MLKQCIGDSMLKKDKRYQDLAIKVATRMCKGHMAIHLENSAPEGMFLLSALHMSLFPETDAKQLKKVLSDSFYGAMEEYTQSLAEDDAFMEVLVDELGLSLSDIDFDKALSDFSEGINRMLDDVVESAMQADFSDYLG